MRTAFIYRSILILFTAAPAVLTGGSLAAAEDAKIEARYDSLDRTVLTYVVNGFQEETVAINGRDHIALSLDHAGFVMMDRAGHPRLPVLCSSLMIPDAARMEVRVLRSSCRDIEGVDLAPWKGPIPRSTNPESVEYSFGEAYGKDAWFPGETASLRDPFILHDVRGVVVEVFPFQYNPVRKVLRVYSEIEVEVAASGPGTLNTIDRAAYSHRPDRAFEALYMNQFVNYSRNRGPLPAENGDLLIICHGPFMDAVQPLAEWKNAAMGINAYVVDAAAAGRSPAAVHNYITKVYDKTNLAYVLLVGDFNEIMSPYYKFSYVSDAAYSTITADWYPDVFVGRFSAEDIGHVETQVERTIAYESESHDFSAEGWNTFAMGIASNEGSGLGHYGEADFDHEDLIRNELLSSGFTKVDRIYQPTGMISEVADGLNEGRRVVNYTGHGSNQGWNTPKFTITEVNGLTNMGRLPFICSVASYGGAFDSGTCFGEAWLRATHNREPTGAVACYMASMSLYWAEPMYAQGNHAFNGQYGAAERLYMELNRSVGGQWYGGSTIMMDITGSSGRDNFMTWNIFGDPSLRLLGKPDSLTLAADCWTISVNGGDLINFTLTPGISHAGDQYVLLGCHSGTKPGTPLPGGLVMPLNADEFTNLITSHLQGSVFQNFRGTLDAAGEAAATLDTSGIPPKNPLFVGRNLYFSALVWNKTGNPDELATNVQILTITN